MSGVFPASFPGVCNDCGEPYGRSDSVAFVGTSRRASHADCAQRVKDRAQKVSALRSAARTVAQVCGERGVSWATADDLREWADELEAS